MSQEQRLSETMMKIGHYGHAASLGDTEEAERLFEELRAELATQPDHFPESGKMMKPDLSGFDAFDVLKQGRQALANRPEQAKGSEVDELVSLLAACRDIAARLAPGVADDLLMQAAGGPSEVPAYIEGVISELTHPAPAASVQAKGGEAVAWPLRAQVWKRESTQEWILEIAGTLGDTDMNIRHTQPLSVAYENVPGLPTFYATPAPAASAEREARVIEQNARKAAQEQLYAERERHTAEVKRLQAEIGRLKAPAASVSVSVSDDDLRKAVDSVRDPNTVSALHNGYYTLTPDELRRVIAAMSPGITHDGAPLAWCHLQYNEDGTYFADCLQSYRDSYANTPLFALRPDQAGDQWREAVEDWFVIDNTDMPEDPREAIKKLIATEVRDALDPSISSAAAALVQAGVQEDVVRVPLQVLKDASEALGNFVSDHGWDEADMQAMDNLDAYIAQHAAMHP